MRNTRYKYLLLGAAVFFSSPDAGAQEHDAVIIADQSEQVVITATRANDGAALGTLGASVTLFSADDLETRQTRAVADILRDAPGVSVNRSGPIGGQTQIRLRGAEANQTLVLIDGMEASNPFYGEFDFATLIADDVARIEVLRGQQSALYGSDAIGGVVHYITLSGAERAGVSARAEYGSHNSYDAAARWAGLAGDFDYALSAGYQSTDGEPGARGGVRDLGAENAVLSARLAYEIRPQTRLRFVGRYHRTQADVNGQDFAFPPGASFGMAVDGDNSYENYGGYSLLALETEGADRRWSSAVTLQGFDGARRSFAFGALSAHDQGGRAKASWVGSLRFGGDWAQTLTAAVDAERERFRTSGPFLSEAQSARRSIESTGAVLEYEARFDDRVGFGAALRHDQNEMFADADTYRVQASARVTDNVRVHAAAGSGVKNPGVFELFGFDPDFFIGNPNLKPERSEGWEVGLDLELNKTFGFDLTYFDAQLKDEIVTDFVGPTFIASPKNSAGVSTQRGVEASARASWGRWRAEFAYTYLDATEAGLEEVRRPPHSASLTLAWRDPNDRGGVFLAARYNGAIQDFNFTLSGPPRVELPAFTLLNLGGDVRLSEHVSAYARVENALDERYEEVFTYVSPGRSATIGLRARY